MSKQSTAPTLAEALADHQGDWMRKALSYSGVSAKGMAAYLDVDAATVSRWINGHQAPSRQTLLLWAMRTGVPVSYLETGRLDEESPRPVGPSGLTEPKLRLHPVEHSAPRPIRILPVTAEREAA